MVLCDVMWIAVLFVVTVSDGCVLLHYIALYYTAPHCTALCTHTMALQGATFYYEPEVTFSSLLTQRRRWINGTVASFMYFFSSSRWVLYGGAV